MKKVLIISHDFYNQDRISTVRVRGLVRFLPSFDLDTVVLCADLGKNIVQPGVESVSYVDRLTTLKKIIGQPKDEYYFDAPTEHCEPGYLELSMRFISDLLLFPESEHPWVKSALPVARKIMKKENIDGIISSSFPGASHVIAHILKKEFDIKWIADYRDLWSGNPYFNHNGLIEGMLKSYEKRIIGNADWITSVSPYISEDLYKLHKIQSFTITNGFNPLEYRIERFIPQNKFTITHTGNLYFGKRDPEPFLLAIKGLIASGKIPENALSIRFIGCSEKWLFEMIDSIGIGNITHVQGKVSREESLRIQAESNVLLLLSRNHPSEIGIYTGKIFDYLAKGLPLLSFGYNEGVLKELFIKTRCGYHTSTVDELSKAIFDLYNRYRENPHYQWDRDEDEVMKYSQKKMAQKFATILQKGTID